MTSKNKLFSKALFLENIRRFWLIDLAAFAFYLLSGPVEIISENGELTASTVRIFISSGNPGFLFLGAALSVIAAVTVFSYLNKTGSTCVIHSMPFSRRKLFNTNYISGLFVALLPLVLTSLILLCFAQPVNTLEYGVDGIADVVMNSEIYSVRTVMQTLGYHVVNIVFAYSLSVLACVLSGNGVIATLTACAFNCLAPALYLCMLGYASVYLFGYTDKNGAEPVLNLHPMLKSVGNYFINGKETYTIKFVVLYVLIAVAAVIAAYYIYKLRPLETAGDSYSFPIKEKFVVICITFLVSSAFGLLFMSSFEKKSVAYFVLFVTAIAAFFIGQMIAKKSFHVFNLQSLKMMLLSLAIVFAVIIGFATDAVIGFENKVPEIDEIESVELNSWDLFISNENVVLFSAPETVEAARGFHQDIVDNKEYIQEKTDREIDISGDYPIDYNMYIDIKYLLKDGDSLVRSYVIPESFVADNKNMLTLKNSDEALAGLYALRDIHFDGAKITYTSYGKVEEGTFIPEMAAPSTVEVFEDGYPDTFDLPDKIMPDLIEAIIVDEIASILPSDKHSDPYLGYISIELPVTVIGNGIESDAAMDTLNEIYRHVYGFNWVNELSKIGNYEVYFSFDVRANMPETLKVLSQFPQK